MTPAEKRLTRRVEIAMRRVALGCPLKDFLTASEIEEALKILVDLVKGLRKERTSTFEGRKK